MDPYTPPPPIRIPGSAEMTKDRAHRATVSLLLGGSGLFSLGAAVGSGHSSFALCAGILLVFAWLTLRTEVPFRQANVADAV